MQQPVDHDFDELTARSALASLWLAGALVGVPALVIPASSAFYAIISGMLLGGAAAGTLLRRRLTPRAVSRFVLAITAVVVVVAAWLSGGTASPAFRSYAVALVGGLWLVFSPRTAMIGTVVSVSVLGGITWASTLGWLPEPWVAHTPWSTWLTVCAACALLAAVQHLEMNRLRTSFAVARTELGRSKEAQQQAAISERRYAEVVSTVPGVVYEFEIRPDGARTFTFVSEGARQLFECVPEEIVRDAATVFAMVDPPAQLPDLEASIAQSYASLEPWEVDGTIRTPTGRLKWVRGQAVPTRHADGTVRWHGILTDITARRTAEQALGESQAALKHSLSLLQSAFESTADGLLVVDLAGRVTGYNQKFLSLWRVPQTVADAQDADHLIGHVRDQLAAPDEFLSGVKDLRGRPEAVSFDTLVFKDGRRFERYSQPQVVDGGVVGRVWSFRDVTARVDEERRRADLEKQLQHAHTLEALGTLSGGIAHDFNNLLTVILGHAEVALDEPSAPRRQESLHAITEAGFRASALVRQIREFSQPRATERSVLAVAQSIGSAVHLLRTTMPKSIEVAVTLNPQVTMFANATQVQQVVTNLVLNAAQAIGDGTGRIEISLDEVGSADAPSSLPKPVADRYARLTVRDTGRGIAADVLPRIFDPFFTTKTAAPGSGLGLAVVHGIVRRHAGAIAVESTPGNGTAVCVFWPALPPVEAGRRSVTASAPAPVTHAGKGRHILVVDDEPEIAKVVADSLRRMDYRVSATSDPLDALNLFRRDPSTFDAVLSDLSMPRLSGIDLGRRILEVRPEIPIVLFTGYNAEFGTEQARALGFRALLNKPMTPAILAEALHRALGTQTTGVSA